MKKEQTCTPPPAPGKVGEKLAQLAAPHIEDLSYRVLEIFTAIEADKVAVWNRLNEAWCAQMRVQAECNDRELIAMRERVEAAKRDRDHWREARRSAIEAGDMLKAERAALAATVERVKAWRDDPYICGEIHLKGLDAALKGSSK